MGIGQKLVVVLAGIVFRIEKVLYIPKHHPEGSLGVDRKGKTDKEGYPHHSEHKRSVILSKAKNRSTPT
jgi:hypothetical protein